MGRNRDVEFTYEVKMRTSGESYFATVATEEAAAETLFDFREEAVEFAEEIWEEIIIEVETEYDEDPDSGPFCEKTERTLYYKKYE